MIPTAEHARAQEPSDRLAGRSLPTRGIILALFTAALVAMIVTLGRLASSPLRYDETEFAMQADAIVERGVPMVPNAGGRILYVDGNYYRYPPEARYGMWHPPMYLYSLALGTLIGGRDEAGKRLVGFAWLLGSLALATAIAGQIAREALPVSTRGTAAALALLTPLLMEGSLFLDIDNTSLAFALLLLIHVFLKRPHDGSFRRAVLLGLLFAFALWSKLTTPFILLGCVGLFHLGNREWRLAFVQTPLVAITGCAVFATAYLGYCALFDYPADFMFRISYLGKSDMYAAGSRLIPAVLSLRWNFVWISPAIALLLLVTVLRRAAHFTHTRRLEPIDLLVIFGTLTVVAYTAWAGMIGKYTFPGVLALVIAAAELIRRDLATVEPTRLRWLVAGAVCLALLHLVFVPPLQVKPALTNAPARGLLDSVRDPRNLHLALALAGIVAMTLLSRIAARGPVVARITLALVACAIVANPISAAKIAFSPHDRSPYRPLEERGFAQLTEGLNARFTPSDTVFIHKDAGYYFHGPHYRLEDVWMWQGVETVVRLLKSGRVVATVDSRAFPAFTPEMVDAAGLLEIATHGDWIIYQPAAANGERVAGTAAGPRRP